MTKVSYTISNGTTSFSTTSYSEALIWKDKGWKIETVLTRCKDVCSSKDLIEALK